MENTVRDQGTIRHDEHDQRHHDRHGHEPKQTVAAVFGSREEARQALKALHKAHYTKSWYGVTSAAINSHGDETLTAESASGGLLPNSLPLVDALVEHGVTGDTARSIEATIDAGEAVVTVHVEQSDVAEARRILRECGGQTGTDATSATDGYASASTSRLIPSYAGDDTAFDWEEETYLVQARR